MNLSEFCDLWDEEVESLCKVVHHPGGMIPNPNPAPAGEGAAAAHPTNIPNPGIPVSIWAKNNLKLLCYFLHHCSRTAHPVVAANITLLNV